MKKFQHYKKKKTKLHFVGIGGIGMSGIAEVFLNQGYVVTGSDIVPSETLTRLENLGIKITIGHQIENVLGSNVVVFSSAVKADNPEIIEAKRLKIPVISRAEMLGELMRGQTGIAVAGTHGKTTTTSMLATILIHAGFDPTLIIGGKVDSLGGSAKLGKGEYIIAEADESDGSFLHLPLSFAIVTNIDNDHLDYFGSLHALEESFLSFTRKIPFYGLAIVCGDDPGVKRCLSRLTKPYLTYGLTPAAHYFASDICHVDSNGLGSQFKVFFQEQEMHSKFLGTIQINVPGKHNVLNALACVGVALQLDIPFEKIAEGLLLFHGVKRRFDIRWQDQSTQRMIVDDYAHHPVEILATLCAAKEFWQGRIISVFQPHRYSRLLHCHDGFLSAFHKSDLVLVLDVYTAGEEPIDGLNSRSLVTEMQKFALPHQKIFYCGSFEQAKKMVVENFSQGDMLLCLGAGSVTQFASQLAKDYAN